MDLNQVRKKNPPGSDSLQTGETGQREEDPPFFGGGLYPRPFHWNTGEGL